MAPKVPTLQPGQVQTNALPNVRLPGVDIGQVETPQIRFQPQNNLSEMGQTIARVAGGLYQQHQQIRQEQIQKQNRVVLRASERELMDAELEILYNPKSGAMTKRGRDAFSLPDDTGTAYDKVADQIRTKLNNDEQRAEFEEIYSTRKGRMSEKVMVHTGREMQVYNDAEIEAYIANATTLAVQSGNPAEIATERQNIVDKRLEWAEDRGLGREQVEAHVLEDTTRLHSGVISSLLSQQRDVEARMYFKQFRNEIAGSVLPQIEKSLQAGKQNGDAIRHSDKIISQFPYGTQGVNKRTWMDEAAKVQDPEVRKELEGRLNTQYQIFEQDAADAKAAQGEAAKSAVDQWERDSRRLIDRGGLAVDALKTLPGWYDMPDDVQKSAIAYANAMQKGPEKIETDWGVYTELRALASTNPQEFAKQDPMAWRGKLANSEYEQMVQVRSTILEKKPEKTDELLFGFRSVKQVIDDTLEPLGFDVTPEPGTPESKAYGSLMDQLEKRVIDVEKRTQKKAGTQEIRAELDQLLLTIPGKKGAWSALFPGGEPFFDQPGQRAFEILQTVPADVMAQINAVLKQGNQPNTPENQIRVYREYLKTPAAKARGLK